MQEHWPFVHLYVDTLFVFQAYTSTLITVMTGIQDLVLLLCQDV